MTDTNTETSPVTRVAEKYETLAAGFEAQAARYRAAVEILNGATIGDMRRVPGMVDEIDLGLGDVGQLALGAVADEIDLRVYVAGL